jgi:hypothetical protein
MNVDTGEYIKILETIQSGEEIHVFTHFAGKRVTKIIGTTSSNAFNLIDVGSTFLQLAAGRNTLHYDAETNMDLLECTILYHPQFLRV